LEIPLEVSSVRILEHSPSAFCETPRLTLSLDLLSSTHAPTYSVLLLILLFFIVIWAMALLLLGHLSTTHAWLIPVFAISLGAPRWCQMLWSTSGIGLHISLPGSTARPILSALLSRSLWLHLGVLDALQGVGFGILLLQTLTRIHVAATLCSAQFLGGAIVILAKAVGPSRHGGAGDVFPNFGILGIKGLESGWFWGGLVAQLVICVGFAKVFRGEQLARP
jgi:alpha-1,3-glucan synthase